MSEREELELEAAIVARAQEEVAGIVLSVLDPGRINAFCGHCDWAASSCHGRVSEQARYVARNWCGWSSRNGKRITGVFKEGFELGDQKFTRDQLSELDAALAKREK